MYSHLFISVRNMIPTCVHGSGENPFSPPPPSINRGLCVGGEVRWGGATGPFYQRESS